MPKLDKLSSPSVSFLKDSKRDNYIDIDADFLNEEEGKAIGTIRGNTNRKEKAMNLSSKLKESTTLKLKLRRQPTKWQDKKDVRDFDDKS